MNKKTTLIKSLTLVICLFGALNFGFGQIITFEFNGLVGDETSVISNSNDPNLSSSTITRGSGLFATNNANRFNAQSWALTNIANAVSGNNYMEFTIVPNSGYEFNVTTININFQRSETGVRGLSLRSSIDSYASDIDGEKIVADVTTEQTFSFNVSQLNSSAAVTYRFYGWSEAIDGSGGFEGVGNDITVNGTVSALSVCSGTTVTYNGGWSSTPDLTTPVIIQTSYDTSLGSFQACSLTVIAGVLLNVNNNTFVEVQNDVTVDGTLTVQTQGNFVQYGNSFVVNPGGTAFVNKTTALKQNSFYYTYWSSPVKSETIDNAFPFTPTDRRFWYNAANYIDRGDGIDNNANDWTLSAGTDIMEPGRGYAATSSPFGFYPGTDSATFIGEFNTGDVLIGISQNLANTYSWNFIGNPYPSAIDFNAFYSANSSVLDGVAYFWSQSLPPNNTNPGNEAINLSQNDYATYTVGSGGSAGASGEIPDQYVPSGQGFFVVGLSTNNATFTNSMRIADGASNTNFFKTSSTKGKSSSLENKLWVNLTTDNGVFNQVLISYVDGATDANDGLSYDAPRNINSGFASILYTNISYSDKKYVIQGISPNNLSEEEIISLGFDTNIDVATIYTLSLAKLQGDFLSNNTVYLKDHFTNNLHDLSASDYHFTSAVGEFKDRFDIVFNAKALSAQDFDLEANAVIISQVDQTHIRFKASKNLSIKTISIYDLLGRQLYELEGSQNEETYHLPQLNQSVFIAKVALSNGALITRKAVKK